MYETRREHQKSPLHGMRQAVDNQSACKHGELHMLTLRKKAKKSRIDRAGDYILDKLYQIELHKDDICFLTLVVVVSYFGWQMLKAWIF